MAISNSIVDYLKSAGQDSSYATRKKLAEENGITGYTGTAAQNTNLLKLLNDSAPKAPSASDTQGIPTYTSPKESSQYTPMSTPDMSNRYQQRLTEYEDYEPEPYSSPYESKIQSIVDGILNKKPFDIKSDPNYQGLYDLYKQRYENEASRSMRDTMANAAALTGGYGNTYAQAVGQQAYDRTMEGLNDRNAQLMGLAVDMYNQDLADRYNQLNSLINLDNAEYSRYRDSVSDAFNQRNYYAGRYAQEYGNAYGEDNDTFNRALTLANNGIAVPETYKGSIDDETWNQINVLANNNRMAEATKTTKTTGGGSSSSKAKSYYSDVKSELKTRAKKSLTDAYNYLYDMLTEGKVTEEEANDLYDMYLSDYIVVENRTGANFDPATIDTNDERQNDWVYIDGLGQISARELYKLIQNGKIREVRRNNYVKYVLA